MFDMAEIAKKLDRLEQLVVLLTKIHLMPILKTELAEPQMAQLYQLTGSYGQRDLAKKLNLSRHRISDAWQRWEQLGLLIKDGQEYRRVL